MDTLNDNKVLASRNHNFFIWISSQGIYLGNWGIPWELIWAEIFILISTQSLPTSSKILKTKLFQWISNTIHSLYTGFNITPTTRYSKNLSKKKQLEDINFYYWSQFEQSLSTNLYLNETPLVPSQQGRTVKRWKLYLTINHLLLTSYNNFRCNWLPISSGSEHQNNDANGLLSNLQYGQISTKQLYHAHLMKINPDHNPLSNIT